MIVEVNENSHVGYYPTCEENRLGEIWWDVYHRQIVFTWFNTDKYKDNDDSIVSLPWRFSKLGLCTIKSLNGRLYGK